MIVMTFEDFSSTKSNPLVDLSIQHQIHKIMLDEGNVDCRCPLIIDGKIHRFSIVGRKKNNRDGWYVIYLDQPISGAYGDWSDGISHKFCTKSLDTLSLKEHEKYNARMKQALTKRDADKKSLAIKAKGKAKSIWINSKSITDHGYLQSKRVQLHGLRQNENGQLIVPLLDVSAEIHSLQFINKNGSKYFLSDGAIKGHFYPIGKETNTVCICEGYSTAASVHESTRHYTIVAFNANNLEIVAGIIRGKYPDLDIIICGDNDQFKEINTGKESATKAAKSINARLVLPQFKSLESKPTDFNDLHTLEGGTEVKRQIENAVITSNISQNTEWPDPKPLTPKLKPVDELDYEMLPKSLACFVRDCSERMQCPPDFIAVSLIITFSSLIGRKIIFEPKKYDNWKVFVNLWGLLIGRPTSMKSPALKSSLEKLTELQNLLIKEHLTEMKEFAMKMKVFDLLNKNAKSEAERKAGEDFDSAVAIITKIEEKRPKQPEPKRYFFNDSSIEKLGELLATNTNGLLLVRDEMSGFLKSISSKDAKNDRPFFLEAWSGNSSYTYDRIGRGTIHIEHAMVSILGGIQPGTFSTYINEALAENSGDDGLMQRFQLMVYPDLSSEWCNVDRLPDIKAKETVDAVMMQLHELNLPQDIRDTPIAKFSSEAQPMFDNWLQEHETRLRSKKFNPSIESHLSKYKSLIPSLALIFKLCDTPNIKDLINDIAIDEISLMRALAFAEYLEKHVMRIYDMSTKPHIEMSRLILSKIGDGKLINSFTNKDVWRPQWSGLTDSKQTARSLGYLVSEGYLKEVSTPPSKQGGTAKIEYYIHPSIKNRLDIG